MKFYGENNAAMTEKRGYPRIRCDWSARLQIINDEPLGEWASIVPHDISAGGLCFYHDESVERDTLLKVMIKISSMPKASVCFARVVRAQRVPGGSFEVGAIFIQIDQASKHAIALAAETAAA